MENKSQEMKGGKNTELCVQMGIIAILVMIIAFSAGKIYANGGNASGLATEIGAVSASEIIPKGVPAVYGTELKVKYDDVSASSPSLAEAAIQKLSAYEDKSLNSEQMGRYLKIGGSIACEYCCGAETLIFSNGERACGCAHSYAMRGLAKYLLINHPEMSDLDILSELGKWKVLFFPGIHEQKAKALEANGIDSKDYINLASNKYRGIEQDQASRGDMVGGC